MQRNYVYIAGPYMGSATHDAGSYMSIDENIHQARLAMKRLVERGYGVFCPHTHSAHFEVIVPTAPVEYWYELDLNFLPCCDVLLRLPGESRGADKEVEVALRRGMPVYYDIETLYKEVPPIAA